MNETKLALYWSEIPTDKDFSLSYSDLCKMWNCEERRVRNILHELSFFDDGSNFILIRSSRGNGFYKTDDPKDIKEYRNEILNRGKNIFASLRKINRVLVEESSQYELKNNLRLIRSTRKLSLSDVVEKMKEYDSSFDKPMLSKMENNFCLPTPFQIEKLSEIYGCKPAELLNVDFLESW